MKIVTLILCVLLLSVIFTSGCIQTAQEEKQGKVTGEVLDKAYDVLNQELDQAVENITAEDIENALLSQ